MDLESHKGKVPKIKHLILFRSKGSESRIVQPPVPVTDQIVEAMEDRFKILRMESEERAEQLGHELEEKRRECSQTKNLNMELESELRIERWKASQRGIF